MTKRSSLVLAFSLVSSLFCASGPTLSDEIINLKFSQVLGPKSFFQVDVVDPWIKELEAKTKGRVKIDSFDGTTPLGGISDQATNVRTGKVDIALGLRGAEGDKFPGSSLIELPFVTPSAALGSAALWRLYKDGTLAEEYRDYKVLALFVHNPGLIHTSKRPVRVPSDLKGMRLRSPNNTVSEALTLLSALPVVLQVNDVMPAFNAGRLDGIVTNWGNPLPGFNEAVKYHTEVKFYTSAFFILMNKDRYAQLPADVRAAIDSQTGDVWVEKLGQYWSKWDAPVREGASGPGHEIIVPDAAQMALWKGALAPATDSYIASLAAGKFPAARAAYDKLTNMLK